MICFERTIDDVHTIMVVRCFEPCLFDVTVLSITVINIDSY